MALAEWRRIVPILLGLGILTPHDGPALALYCDAYATWCKAAFEVQHGALVIETDLGGTKANPAVAIARDARRQMMAFLGEFGLTPTSRARLAPAAPPADALSEFLGP